MENFLPFTDGVMVVLVHKCVQQTYLLALHLETLGYIPRLLNALNLIMIGQLVSEIFMFESVDERTDGRTPARVPYYKLTLSLRLW